MSSIARMRVIAGPNGSGKTTLASRLKNIVPFGLYLNADHIEKELIRSGRLNFYRYPKEINTKGIIAHFKQCSQLKKYDNYSAFIQTVKVNHRSILPKKECINSYVAASINDFLRAKCLQHKLSFTFETVMSHESKIDLIQKANDLGFRTYLYFVSTDRYEINIARVKQRVNDGGHAVPNNKIKSRYVRTMGLLLQAIIATKRAFIFDNSGKDQLWFAEITAGNIIDYKAENIPSWFSKIISK